MKKEPDEQTGFTGWVKKHRKAIIITSLSVFVVASAALVGIKVVETQRLLAKLAQSKNRGLDPSFPSLEGGVKDAIQFATDQVEPMRQKGPIYVMAHPRNLASGHNASQRQIDLAVEYGCRLKPNQTFVTSYEKCCA